MILPGQKDALHKAMLYRVLISLIDDEVIGRNIHFRGGTCASMLNFLDRFSVDLDFDLRKGIDKTLLDKHLRKVLTLAAFDLRKESHEGLLYTLRYQVPVGQRNSIKLDIIDTNVKSNKYASLYLPEIGRYANCQTIETMLGHKLVTITDRYKKYKTIAGRDIYDVHYFFSHGYTCRKEIIEERTGVGFRDYLRRLVEFIGKKISQRIIDQDLNTLLPRDKFIAIRKTLKQEVLVLLQDEIKRA